MQGLGLLPAPPIPALVGPESSPEAVLPHPLHSLRLTSLPQRQCASPRAQVPCLGPLNPLSWTPYSPPPRTRSLAPQCRPSGTLEFHPTPPLPPGPVCSISCSSRKGALLSLASLPEPFVCWVCRKLYGRWPRAHLPQGPEGGGF